MRRAILSFPIVSALVLVSSLGCGGARRLEPVPPPAPVTSPPRVMTATCKSMSYADGTMDVITGVSQSLRVVRFRVDEATAVVVGGTPGELSDLAPGKVVRIRYTTTPEGNMADRIEEVLDSTEMR